MTTIEADVEAGPGANRRWEYDQLAWGYSDETDGGGGGGGGECVSDGDVVFIVFSVDEHKRASNDGSARRRIVGRIIGVKV